ncbi:unnamed protein product [Gordionus sp. m RMFG-2023]
MSINSETSEVQKRRSSRSPFNDRNASKKSRIEQLEMETRILIPSKHAGAIIGKGGSTINRLREKFAITLSLPDSSTPERVFSLTGGTLKNHIDCLEEVLQILKESNRVENENECELRIIVHQSQAGAVIGKGGNRIKEMRERTNSIVKVYSTMCPNSTDRIVLIAGTTAEIIECLYEVYDSLDKAPPKGPRYNYNPYDYDYYSAPDYGGFQGDRPRGGNNNGQNMPPLNQRSSNNNRGDFRGRGSGRSSSNRSNNPRNNTPSRGGGHHSLTPPSFNFGGSNKMPPPMPPHFFTPGGPGMKDDSTGNRRINMMPPPPSHSDFDNDFNRQGGLPFLKQENGDGNENSTQVTIPKDLAGAIIGRGGERIRQIREESQAKIKIDETIHGDNERIITIEGNSEAIRYAQVLLQDA